MLGATKMHCALCPGKWTVQQAAELSVPAPTIEAALDGRFLSGLKDQRVKAAKLFQTLGATEPTPQPVSSPCPWPACAVAHRSCLYELVMEPGLTPSDLCYHGWRQSACSGRSPDMGSVFATGDAPAACPASESLAVGSKCYTISMHGCMALRSASL